MFGCFDSGQGLTNTPLVQRRVLCFGSQSGEANTSSLDTLKDVMEIKVFRSKGRKRIKPELREFPVLPHSPPGNKKGQQQRMGEAIK